LLRRSSQAGFVPFAWVFPGGCVDPDDRLVPVRGAVSGLDPDHQAAAVAAIRECFEEAGVWLGLGQPPPSLRRALNEGRTRLHQAAGLVADLDRLRLWAHWITPVTEPRRYDTRFFLAAVDEAQVAEHDQREAVSSEWMTPARALERAWARELVMVPPTFCTLVEIQGFETAAQALGAAGGREVWPILPRRDIGPDGEIRVLFPGDPAYPAERVVRGPTRAVLRDGRWLLEP
jgi:8-oxo-dGTP pyrophosphatase MutT (NUDIX family)